MRAALVLAALATAAPAVLAAAPAPAPEGQWACFGIAPVATSCTMQDLNAGALYVRGPCPVNQGFLNCYFGTLRGAVVSQVTGASASVTCDMLPGPTALVTCTNEGDLSLVEPPFDVVCTSSFYATDTPGGAGVFECGIVL